MDMELMTCYLTYSSYNVRTGLQVVRISAQGCINLELSNAGRRLLVLADW